MPRRLPKRILNATDDELIAIVAGVLAPAYSDKIKRVLPLLKACIFPRAELERLVHEITTLGR